MVVTLRNRVAIGWLILCVRALWLTNCSCILGLCDRSILCVSLHRNRQSGIDLSARRIFIERPN